MAKHFVILGCVRNGSLYEADGNGTAIAAKCYRSMRKSETQLKSQLIVTDNCSRLIYCQRQS
jgi:hypothetical protein